MGNWFTGEEESKEESKMSEEKIIERTDEEVEKKYKLITDNLAEVVGGGDIKKILKTRDLKIYWGTAPTGAPHMGYFVPILKIGEFLRAGQNVTILFADIHASLDNLKSSFEVVTKRTMYYEFLIKEMLKLVGVPLEKLKFVQGSSFQYSKEYTRQVYRMSAMTNISKSKHAGADVVKQNKDPLLSGLLYPILQALDEEFLGVDAQFGGVDQRKIFMFARENLPRVGFKKRIHLMNTLIPGLTQSGKMSSSIPNSKIDFFDDDKTIQKKFRKAYSVDGVAKKNCLLMLLKYVLMMNVKNQKRKFVIKKDDEHGGKELSFGEYEEIEKAFVNGDFVSIELKDAVAEEVIKFITPLREILLKNRKIYDEAYPPKVQEKKAEKKKSPFEKFTDEWVEKKKDEFPDMKRRKMVNAIRKKYQIGKLWGKMSQEERKKYE